MGFLTRCKRPFLFAVLLQFCNMLFSFFLKTFLILFEKQHKANLRKSVFFLQFAIHFTNVGFAACKTAFCAVVLIVGRAMQDDIYFS